MEGLGGAAHDRMPRILEPPPGARGTTSPTLGRVPSALIITIIMYL
jgi:hypothetical protein